jgi:uncharacterized protein (DUF608 family)
MWTLIGTYNYILYTNDTDFLSKNWPKYQTALNHVVRKIDRKSGLLSVTGKRDWARWQQGGNNSEANMMLVLHFIPLRLIANLRIRQTISNPHNFSNPSQVA